MLSVKLDPDLEWLLEHDVDDLARYNILRYLHDHSSLRADAQHFADQLGLRSLDRVAESLEALQRSGLLVKEPSAETGSGKYGLSRDPASRRLVERLYRLATTSDYGQIVEHLAARSLHRARKGQGGNRARHRGGQN